ncbi:MAG: hypothetical protein E7292_04610 [Lachnospiraceae bacterium]|nr:hypothetical protein [Lachnospiraceae bacterium]
MSLKEKGYIRYRKRKANMNKLCFYVCSVFPIRKNLVSVCTFEGKGGFGCNPKYIVEELHRRNPEYKFVWFVNDMSKQFPDYIKKVPNTLWSRAYWLSVSKVWIDNYRKPYGTRKRKGQYYINTWHGATGFKSIGLWRGKAFSKMAYLVSKNDSDMIDCVPVDSEWCAQYFVKGLVYEGEFLKSGTARCDIMYGDRQEARDKFREKYHLNRDAKIVMFAPTFREKSVDGKRVVFSELWTLDFKRMLQNLEKRFGGQWILCMRLHPQIAEYVSQIQEIDLKDKIIDASREDDMYEALAAMDALVTDYSSVAMDAGIAKMPVFVYADDIEKYVKDRGSLIWEMSTRETGVIKNNVEKTPDISLVLPFSVAENNEKLEQDILTFDEKCYEAKIQVYNEDIGLVFDGKASKRIVDKIEEMCNALR